MHSDTEQPHDALFKQIFSEPARAAELARAALARQVADAIDWSSLVPVPATFVDPELRDHEADLLFEMRLHDRPALLYLLLEHKSADDRFTVFQMLRYVVRIWERFRRERPQATTLPPVLPLIVHHGPAPWRSPLRLGALVGKEPLPRSLSTLQPDFRALLFDLVGLEERDVRALRASATVRLALLFLRSLRTFDAEQFVAALARWRDLLHEGSPGPGRQMELRALLSYVLATVEMAPEAIERAVTDRAGPDLEATMKTAADILIERGLERGMERGLEAARRTLLGVLRSRFGELSGPLVAKVAAGDLETVLAWIPLAATAADPESVFRER